VRVRVHRPSDRRGCGRLRSTIFGRRREVVPGNALARAAYNRDAFATPSGEFTLSWRPEAVYVR
jgi:hypothetical protein